MDRAVSRLLVVSPYAPYRDGIAAYAVQEVRWLRASGDDVEVLSPLPSAAHHHLPLGRVRGNLALLRVARGYDRVIVQYHPALFFGRSSNGPAALITWVILVALVRLVPVELRIHETNFGVGQRPHRFLSRLFLAGAADRTVHTAAEQTRLAAESRLGEDRFRRIDHGRSFASHTAVDRPTARLELGIHPDAFVFLSIGFLQEHKGFDRALEAFARSGVDAEYHVVGSARVDAPDILAHVHRLRTLCARIPGAHLHDRYVSDAEFDAWIRAADVVVLPYREIWSSGVIERCALAGTPAIVRRVGGLEDQAGPTTRLVDDDEELVVALREAAGMSEVDMDAPKDRAEAQALVRERAAARGGHEVASTNEAVEALRLLPPILLPLPTSPRPWVARVKRVIHRLTAWQLAPLVDQLAELQKRTVAAVESLDAQTAAGSVDRRG